MAVQSYLDWDPLVLEPVFRSIYEIEMNKKLKRDFIPVLYNAESSTKAIESFDGAGGQGLMKPWSRSNNQVAYSQVEELWPKQFKHQKYSDGREIDRDFIDDLKVPQLKNIITDMADSVYKTQQYQAAEIFNNFNTITGTDYMGFPVNSAGPDGKALCAVDHPFSPDNATDVQSNLSTKELTIDTWEEVYVAMQGWVDDRGVLQAALPDTLLVHPNNARVAKQIAGIPGLGIGYEPGNDLHNINVYQGDITVIVNPFLKDPKAWFAIDGSRLKKYNLWFWRRRPETGNITDFDTEVMKYKVIGRWSYGFLSPWFIYGSTGVDPA